MGEIAPDRVVILVCDLCEIDGTVLKAGERLRYLHGGYEDVLPELEKALGGHQIGDVVGVELPPEDGEGEYDAALVRVEPRSALPPDVAVGGTLTGGSMPTFDEQPLEYRVVAIDEDRVVLDGNHPLAGKTLKLRCTVVEVRDATDAEMIAGTPRMQ